MKDKEKNFKPIYVLCALIGVTVLIIYFQFIFGDKLFMYKGSDDSLTYVPLYTSVVNKILTKDFSFMDLTRGVGEDLLATQHMIFDPFAILIYINGYLFGIKIIPKCLIWVNIFKIMCAGVFCYNYLKKFNVSIKSRILVSYIYSFCGYIMLWGQHYFFSTCLVLLPLLLSYIESIIVQDIYKDEILKLVFTVAVIGIYSVYFSYMMFMFAAIYTVLRSIYCHNKFKKIIKKISCVAGCIIFGLCFSAIIFLPSANSIALVGYRLNSNSNFVTQLIQHLQINYDKIYYKTILGRFFSNNAQGVDGIGTWINYFESPQLFFSVMLVLLIPQWLYKNIFKQKEKKKLIIFLIGFLLVLIMLFIPIGSIVFNGFSTWTGRHTFLLMPIFAVILSSTLDDILYNKNYKFLIGEITCFFSLVILNYFMYLENATRVSKFILIINMLLIYIINILFNKISNNDKAGIINQKFFDRNLVYKVLTVLICINLIIENYPTVNMQQEIAQAYTIEILNENEIYYNSNSINAINYLNENDDELFRVAKDYFDIDGNESSIQNMNSFSSYSSNYNKYYREFLMSVFPLTLDGETGYHTPDFRKSYSAMRLLGAKYIVTKNDIVSEKLLSKFNNVNVYQFENFLPIGFLYTGAIERNEFEKYSYFEKQGFIFNKAVLENSEYEVISEKLNNSVINNPIQEVVSLSFENADIGKDVVKVINDNSSDIKFNASGDESYIDIELDYDKYQYDNSKLIYNATLNVDTYGDLIIYWDTGNGFNEKQYSSRRIEPNRPYQIEQEIPSSTRAIRFRFNMTGIKFDNPKIAIMESDNSSIKRLMKNISNYKITSESDGEINYNISTNENGLLCFTIPYSDDWKMYIDNKKVETFRINIGFIGTYLEKGCHDIKLLYEPDSFIIGKMITGISVLILCSYLLYNKVRNKKIIS
ncbi:MAG: YfhO family protein [Sedimentibacter saalensis]|uniref:YfhO family protein n=1 Tax=Sedimentibacter saalensis TaxID=130788 RepID=UPI0031580E10